MLEPTRHMLIRPHIQILTFMLVMASAQERVNLFTFTIEPHMVMLQFWATTRPFTVRSTMMGMAIISTTILMATTNTH